MHTAHLRRTALAVLIAVGAALPAAALDRPPRPPQPKVQQPKKVQQAARDASQPLLGDASRFERLVRRIRNKHLGPHHVDKLRMSGWDAISSLMQNAPDDIDTERTVWSIFENDREHIRIEALDLLATQGGAVGQRVITERAIWSEDESVASHATELVKSLSAADEYSGKAALVVYDALLSNSDEAANRAAIVADEATLIGAIPFMIQAQSDIGYSGRRSGGSALAYIAVLSQQAYVRSVTPVVNNSTVGFVPEIGVLTEGNVLVVGDAVVVSYRRNVNERLIRLTSRVSGTDTSGLAMNTREWARWFVNEFIPILKRDGHDIEFVFDDSLQQIAVRSGFQSAQTPRYSQLSESAWFPEIEPYIVVPSPTPRVWRFSGGWRWTWSWQGTIGADGLVVPIQNEVVGTSPAASEGNRRFRSTDTRVGPAHGKPAAIPHGNPVKIPHGNPNN